MKTKNLVIYFAEYMNFEHKNKFIKFNEYIKKYLHNKKYNYYDMLNNIKKDFKESYNRIYGENMKIYEANNILYEIVNYIEDSIIKIYNNKINNIDESLYKIYLFNIDLIIKSLFTYETIIGKFYPLDYSNKYKQNIKKIVNNYY